MPFKEIERGFDKKAEINSLVLPTKNVRARAFGYVPNIPIVKENILDRGTATFKYLPHV